MTLTQQPLDGVGAATEAMAGEATDIHPTTALMDTAAAGPTMLDMDTTVEDSVTS